MDNAVFRTRIQTNPYSAKKKYGTRNRISYKERLGLQTAVCLLILMLAGIIRNADTNITRSLSEKIGTSLSADMDIKQLISPFTGFISDSFNKSSTSVSEDDIINPLPESLPADKKTDKAAEAANTPQDTAGKGESAAATQNNSATLPAVTTVKYPGIFITPAAGTLGSPFGDTVDQLTQKTKSHKGLDIEAPNGTDIKAAADGIVLESSFEKTLGYYVKIEHSNGYNTIYAQCSQLTAKKGQNVKQGDVIAKVGSTGVSVGNHLHFEIWKDGKAVDPIDYIKVTAK